ncbi:MAG: Glycosyltransferases involved in cell wall bioproteini [Parcubacteria group bacterium Gr01-1014_70]|nr:MAG: Glycosyltransferases involved in cell wall bioproteini [Parcubacteria group bacterium Gr01-1014_70]
MQEETKPYLSVIVPAYNEEQRIEKTLRHLDEYLRQQAYTYEILVVVDKATDKTADIVRGLETHIPHLRLLWRDVNFGKGGSVSRGMLEAIGEIRLFTDADNSTDISHFEKMKPLFDQGYDVVISSRNPLDVKGATQAISQPFYKRILGIAGNIFVQVVAVWGIWDTQNGFKAFRNTSAEKIFSQITITRWGFDIEVLALARALKLRIGIIPAHWINDEASHVKFSAYFEVLWETVRVRWNLIRGVYKL